MFKTIAFCLLAWCLPLLLSAQAPTLKKYANSAEITETVTEIAASTRFSYRFEDGMPADAGYVYEFGPIVAYRLTDSGRELIGNVRESEVMNAPVLNFAIGPQRNPDLVGTVEIELAWLKRYNPNDTVDKIELPDEARRVRLVVHP